MRPGFRVELAVSEPLVVDPVAIDFASDGALWVVEMHDYPSGLDGNWKPGGRVKRVVDRDGDGRFDHADTFLDSLPFPTDVMAWRKGALVCAAPDIIYAEDSDGDGRADKVEKLFTGFLTDNYQARVNGLTLGLDNWVHGANGLRGGVIRSSSSGRELNIRGKDFRIKPDLGLIELESGYTQQGRTRDDWGNWFGGNNSSSLFHYPLPHRYAKRNPHVVLPNPRVYVPGGTEPERVYPVSVLPTRFNRPEHANRVTSGCGIGIYRDDLLGEEFYGDAFICEPVHNLVRRLKLSPKGSTFRGRRAEGEEESEFFASKDPWSRPVQAATGPDGALWVVDMYRHVIEHPRWIPEERLRELDVRAGADRGRIYRVLPDGGEGRPVRDLRGLPDARLAGALESPNGTVRDLAHRELLHRGGGNDGIGALRRLVVQAKLPAVRTQALCVLDGMGGVDDRILLSVLADEHPEVRRQAVRLCEGRFGESLTLGKRVAALAKDPDPRVRYQVALSLGEWKSEEAGRALAVLARNDAGDDWMRAAILSSSVAQPQVVLRGALADGTIGAGRARLAGQLSATAAAVLRGRNLGEVFKLLAPESPESVSPWQWRALASLQDALDRQGQALGKLVGDNPIRDRLTRTYARAAKVTSDTSQPDSTRLAALSLVGRGFNDFEADLAALADLLEVPHPPAIQEAAVGQMTRRNSKRAPGLLLEDWARHSPGFRATIVSQLMRRPEWIHALLDAVEQGRVAVADIDPVTRLRLSRNSDPKITERLEKLLPQRDNASRKEVLKRYSVVEGLKGDPAQGKEVFRQNCAACHAVAGIGFTVGPDLSIYRNKNLADFLAGILDPNAIIEPRFTGYNIETRDDESLTGLIVDETAESITVLMAQGLKQVLPRSNIERMDAASLSLMPEGFEASIAPRQMADLIAFLKAEL